MITCLSFRVDGESDIETFRVPYLIRLITGSKFHIEVLTRILCMDVTVFTLLWFSI